MIRTLVLDWAGTLADDVELTLEATNATLRALGGEPVDMATYRREFIVPVMGFYGPRLPGRTLDEIDETFFSEYRARAEEVRLFEGALRLLWLARARSMNVMILSTLPADVIEASLEALELGDLIDGIHGGAADKREVLPDLLEQAEIDPDTALFVGDSPNDVAAARAAGCRSGAALFGYTPGDRLRDESPDYLFASLEEVMSAIDREHLFDSQPLVIATVGGVILDDEDRILLVKTRKWSGTYGIPGGKIDHGESMEAAYAREIREETGLELEDTRFVMIQDCIDSSEFIRPRHFLLINYISRAVRPENLRTNYEIEDAVWATLDETSAMKLNEPTRTLLDEIARRGLMPSGGTVS